jgi:hypothetical protein
MKQAIKTIAAIIAIAVTMGAVAGYSWKKGHAAAYENICENIIGGMWYKGQCVDPRAIILREPGAIS